MHRRHDILFDASPMVDNNKTGVGFYVSHLIASLGAAPKTSVRLTGYYFDFMNRGHKVPPTVPNVRFRRITLVPGKILSLCRRLGFQPILDVFTRSRADVILFTNYVSLPNLFGKRNAVIIYDLSFLDHPEYLQNINLHYLQRFCPPSIRRADLIVTISEFTKTRLEHHFPEITAAIIVTPIPPLAITTSSEVLSSKFTEMGIRPGKFLLYLGTIEPRKNIQKLVQAYALLPAPIRQEYSLVLAGGKGWKDDEILAEVAKQRSAGNSIILTGYISDEEKVGLYRHATCFCMPSHYEGFGMPVLEAMQYGTPVAISDIPVFREVAADAAVYFDKDNATTIATTLANLITNASLQHELIQKGKERLQSFSWDANARAVYHGIERLFENE